MDFDMRKTQCATEHNIRRSRIAKSHDPQILAIFRTAPEISKHPLFNDNFSNQTLSAHDDKSLGKPVTIIQPPYWPFSNTNSLSGFRSLLPQIKATANHPQCPSNQSGTRARAPTARVRGAAECARTERG